MIEGPRTSHHALEVEHLTKRYELVDAVKDVSLAVARGEVHALLGENGAGKTTLMNCIYGMVQPDSGDVYVDGSPARINRPADALSLGIGMVHQTIILVPDMTVNENIALSAHRGHLGPSHLSSIARNARSVGESTGLSIDPHATVSELTIGQKHRVEILKVLVGGASILILDEPTTVLTPQEWTELARAIRLLAERGSAVVFITHKLDEVLGIADRYTVLRQGAVVGSGPVAGTTEDDLARLMVGRAVTSRGLRPRAQPGPPALEVQDLHTSGSQDSSLNGISFSLREREVLGVAGVDGNGQRDLIEALTGTKPLTHGAVSIRDQRLPSLSPGRFTQLGGGVISEDRQRSDLALDLSIAENLMLRDFTRVPFSRYGVLQREQIRQRAHEAVERFGIQATSIDVPVGQLSGGNQQKVVLARELQDRTRLLIASQPTRGLDVGAAQAIYEELARFKEGGGATLLISTELDEVLSVADRIAVLLRGRFVGIVPADQASTDLLGLMMSGAEVDLPPENRIPAR